MLRHAGTILGVVAVLLMLAVASGLLCDGPGGEQPHQSVLIEMLQNDDGLTIDASILARPEWATIDTAYVHSEDAEPANLQAADVRANDGILDYDINTTNGDMRAGLRIDGPASDVPDQGHVTRIGRCRGAGVRARLVV